jgi:hypothetical protein
LAQSARAAIVAVARSEAATMPSCRKTGRCDRSRQSACTQLRGRGEGREGGREARADGWVRERAVSGGSAAAGWAEGTAEGGRSGEQAIERAHGAVRERERGERVAASRERVHRRGRARVDERLVHPAID